MKVLITGGAGMVGSHCAEYFLKQGHKVIVYDNLMRSKIFGVAHQSVEYNWNYLKQFKQIHFEQEDICDGLALNRCFKKFKPNVVIHAASQPGVRFSLDNPVKDFTINALGTMNVLEAFRQVSPKGIFIYCSTNKVYGDHVNSLGLIKSKSRYGFKINKGIDEGFPIDATGHTPYGVSKLCGDLCVQDYAYTYGLRTCVLRMSCIYGTRQFGFEDQGWMAWFANRFVQGKPISIYGDGRQVRDVLWVGDLVDLMARFINSDISSEIFNIGGGASNSLSLLELVKMLEEVTGNHVDIKFENWRPFDQKVYISDISKARRLLGWRPQVLPKEGVARLVEWVKMNRQLFS